MNKVLSSTTLIAMSVCAALLSASVAYADDDGGRRYAVTITNLTRGQIMSPPAVISHNDGYSLFTLGAPSSAELATLAERGSPFDLVGAASATRTVYRAVAGAGPILPGASQTVEIEVGGKFSQISLATMLVSTNDGFAAVRGIPVPRRGALTVNAEAYDAGSEANSENCAFIPGPPCGHDAHDPAPGEGYVHVHAGVHGGAGLTPAMHDWRNPVAQIEIKRID